MAQLAVYATRRLSHDARQQLSQFAHVIEWEDAEPIASEQLIAAISDVEALLCTADDRITREIINSAPRLQVISTISPGFDHIDLEAAAKRNITVCHAPGAAAEAIADLTMAILLACARNVIEAANYVKEQQWQLLTPGLFPGVDVQGSTIGLVGLGSVGLQVAHRASGFGMRVLYFDRRQNHDAELALGIQYGQLDDLLREADFVTVHIPLGPSSYGLLNEPRLRLMKPTAFLINMTRNAVVDRGALVRALREGWIAGAGLDVFDQEPIQPDDPLLELSNVILTPHIGENTPAALESMMRMAAAQVVDVLQGRPPAHPAVPQDEAA